MNRQLNDGTILLRAPEPTDVEMMYLWENDIEAWTDGVVRAPTSLKILCDYVDNYNPDPCATGQLRLIVQIIETGQPIGCIDLYEFDSLNRRSGVGIIIDPQHRGCGYASRALELIKWFCCTHLGLHQLWAIVSRDNETSLRLFSGRGFSTCGSLRSWIRIGNTYTDALMFQSLL